MPRVLIYCKHLSGIGHLGRRAEFARTAPALLREHLSRPAIVTATSSANEKSQAKMRLDVGEGAAKTAVTIKQRLAYSRGSRARLEYGGVLRAA